MILNKIITEEINKYGCNDIDLKVVTHKKKIYQTAQDKNIEMGIYLEAKSEKFSDTFVRYKLTIIPPNEDVLHGVSVDYFCDKAGIPDLIKNPGGKLMMAKLRSGYLCIIKDLWVHPCLRKGAILEEISSMIEKILIEEIKESISGILLIPEDTDKEHQELYWQLGYCLIYNRNIFIYTNYLCCFNLVEVAIEIGAVKTQDEKILVYKTFEDKSKDGYVEVSLNDFVNDVYREGEGQFHILNAVFNNI